MNLHTMLAARAAAGRPVRVGLIGAGKFGSMILSQARHIEGMHIVGVADLDVAKAHASLARVGWPAERYAARTLGDALKTGQTCVLDSAAALAACDEIECIIEATGHPIAGVRHALAAIDGNKHVIMVNVEADCMCGPLLAARARAKNLVYSMAYGDQPAIICELVDWARACGFELTSAGKGMNYEPRYRYSTPDTVWGFFGWSEEEVAKGDFNPKMYNSFTDGTKAAIEMVAVANGTGLDCPDDGLAFPPTGLHDLAKVFRPASDGGRLPRAGLVDIAASGSSKVWANQAACSRGSRGRGAPAASRRPACSRRAASRSRPRQRSRVSWMGRRRSGSVGENGTRPRRHRGAPRASNGCMITARTWACARPCRLWTIPDRAPRTPCTFTENRELSL